VVFGIAGVLDMRIALALVLALGLTAAARAEPVAPDAVIDDPPVDSAHPAGMAYVRVPSHGELMNGVIYTAAGAGPHPTVLLLHGFPGNEQNLDLAQAIRRAGFDVLTLHYRGAWGSPGVFSFNHAMEDADAALAFLRDPAVAAKFGIDGKRLYVAGHSMGGFMAASAVAHDPAVAGLVMISAWDIGRAAGAFTDPKGRQAAKDGEFADDAIPLAGASADALMDEAAANAAAWDFVNWAPALASRPALLVTADDDSYADSHRLSEKLRDVEEVHMQTDHPYSDHRIALEAVVVEWLQRQVAPPKP